LFQQLTSADIPAKETTSVEFQVEALQRVSRGKTVLIILDGAPRLHFFHRRRFDNVKYSAQMLGCATPCRF